ncbi:MAG: glycosyltransferase family 39 protein [Candidatus Aminicenantales bacterium]
MKKISALHLLLALSFVLFAVGIWWGLPDYRGWAPDEIVPARVVDGLRQFFSNGWHERYPPFHFYLLSLVYAPFLLLHKLHILDLRQLSSYMILFYLGRFLSVVMGTAVVYLVYKCGLEIFDRRASVCAALITALIVPFEYYSKMVNLDVPYIFWFVWSIYFFIRILKTQRLKYYLLFAATAVIAVCTKDQAFGLYVLTPIPLILFHWKHEKQSNPDLSLIRSLFDKKYLYFLLAATGLFAIVHNLAFNLQGFLRHLALITGSASESFRIFPRTFSGEIQLLGLTIRQIQGSLGWPLFLVCGAGLVLSLFQKKKNALLLTLPLFAVSYYAFYIGMILFNCDRYNMPICIVLSFFGGQMISSRLKPGPKFFKATCAIVTIIFCYSFFYSLSVDILMIADSRYSIERWMNKNISPEAAIGIAGPVEYNPRLNDFPRSYLPLSLEAFQKAQRPDFVIFPTAYGQSFAKNSPENLFFSRFSTAGEKYELVIRYKTELPWLVIKYSNIGTNMDAVNPEIQIYRRLGLKKKRLS